MISDVSAVGRIPEVRMRALGFGSTLAAGKFSVTALVVRCLLIQKFVEIFASERWETDPSFPGSISFALESFMGKGHG